MTTDKVGRAPLYVRALRLRNLHVGGFGSFVLFECMIAIGVLLALAELVTWWAVLVLPVAVAIMVKINDVAMSGSRARRAAGARERTGLDGVRAEQSRAAYRSMDDAGRVEPGRAAHRSLDDSDRMESGDYADHLGSGRIAGRVEPGRVASRGLDDSGRPESGRAAHRSLDDAERSHTAAHRSYDDADRAGEPAVVQRHTAVLDRDELDKAGESHHQASRHAAERARAAGRGERAGVGAGQRVDGDLAAGQRAGGELAGGQRVDGALAGGQRVEGELAGGRRADSEFAVAGQRTAEQSDQAGPGAPAVGGQVTTSRTIPAAGSVVGGQRSSSGSGTPQSEEVRRPVGVIRISIPPRDGGTRGSATRTTTASAQTQGAEAPEDRSTEGVPAAAMVGDGRPAAARTAVEVEAPVGRTGEVPAGARHTVETAVGAPARVAIDPTTGHVYGEDTGVVPGTGIWLNRPGVRPTEDSYTSQHGDGDVAVHSGQGSVYGRGGYGPAAGTSYGGPADDQGPSVHRGQGAVYGRGGYDTSDGDTTYGGTPRNSGNYRGGVYGSSTSDVRYATADDSDADYGYATDSAVHQGPGGGYGYQPDATDPYGNVSSKPGGLDGDGRPEVGAGADDGYSRGTADSYGSADGYEQSTGQSYQPSEPVYQAGEPAYHASEPAYHAGEQSSQPSEQTYQPSGSGYGGGHGLDDSLWSAGSGQERRSWVGGPAGYDPDPRGDSVNTGYARGAYGDAQHGDDGRHARGRHADGDHAGGRHTDRGWRTEDDATRSRTTTNQGRFA